MWMSPKEFGRPDKVLIGLGHQEQDGNTELWEVHVSVVDLNPLFMYEFQE